MVDGKGVEGWKKVGGQGGSNPGALFEIDKGHGLESPDLSAHSKLPMLMSNLAQDHKPMSLMAMPGAAATAEVMVPQSVNVVTVPRLDGTKGRYDVLYRLGGRTGTGSPPPGR